MQAGMLPLPTGSGRHATVWHRSAPALWTRHIIIQPSSAAGVVAAAAPASQPTRKLFGWDAISGEGSSDSTDVQAASLLRIAAANRDKTGSVLKAPPQKPVLPPLQPLLQLPASQPTTPARPMRPTLPTTEAEKPKTEKVRFSNSDPYIEVYRNVPVHVSGGKSPKHLTSFNQLFEKPFKYAKRLMENMMLQKYNQPTPIQQHAIPAINAGHNVLATAQTGTGKTAAYLVPVIGVALKTSRDGGPRNFAYPVAIILSPTRELAGQIYEECRKLFRHTHLKAVMLVGGVPLADQVLMMRGGVDMIVATPGRLLEHVDERKSVKLQRLQFLVVDEADRMLDLGFEPELRRLCTHKQMPGEGLQTLMFSATLPDEVRQLAHDFLKQHLHIQMGELGSSVDLITQRVLSLTAAQRLEQLQVHAQEFDNLLIVFTNTIAVASQVHQFLVDKGLSVSLIHSDLPQVQRDEAIMCFKFGVTPILVATGVAARGVDIPDVGHVINYDMPDDIDEYVHRIGRTGRAGRRGCATTYFTSQDDAMASDLVKTLHSSKQAVPDWLQALAHKQTSSTQGLAPKSQRQIINFNVPDHLHPFGSYRHLNKAGHGSGTSSLVVSEDAPLLQPRQRKSAIGAGHVLQEWSRIINQDIAEDQNEASSSDSSATAVKSNNAHANKPATSRDGASAGSSSSSSTNRSSHHKHRKASSAGPGRTASTSTSTSTSFNDSSRSSCSSSSNSNSNGSSRSRNKPTTSSSSSSSTSSAVLALRVPHSPSMFTTDNSRHRNDGNSNDSINSCDKRVWHKPGGRNTISMGAYATATAKVQHS